MLRGLARGWPKDRPARLDRETEEAHQAARHASCPPRGAGQLVRLVGPWGDQALDSIGAEIAASLLATAKDETLAEPRRIDAARQLVELRAASDEPSREQLLDLIAPRTLARAGRRPGRRRRAPARRPRSGKALVERAARLCARAAGPGDPGPARPRRLDPGPRRSPSSKNQVRLSELALDQKQALAAHPNREIAAPAKRCSQQAAASPTPIARR